MDVVSAGHIGTGGKLIGFKRQRGALSRIGHPMCKPIWTISFGVPVAGLVLFFTMQAAEAKQCSADMPANPPRHWSYRLIDGRKCWYEGENNFPKALLQWPEQTNVLSAFDKMEPPKEDSPAAVQTVPQVAPNTQPDSATFDARWRALDILQLRN